MKPAPVRLTLGICKLLESGFLKARSCLTNTFFFFFKVTRINEGSPVDIIYLDFQKAFDKKSLWYRGWLNRLDRKIADRQKTACCSRWGGFKLDISFEWGTTRTSIRIFIILNIYIYIYTTRTSIRIFIILYIYIY